VKKTFESNKKRKIEIDVKVKSKKGFETNFGVVNIKS
jgi:hypothetical protein